MISNEALGKDLVYISNLLGVTVPMLPPRRALGEPRYAEFPNIGVSIILNDYDLVTCIQLWSEKRSEQYAGYGGALPGGVNFDNSQEEVRRIYGEPISSDKGGSGRGLFGGFLYPWDLYHFDHYHVHFEYNADATSIRLVSLSICDCAAK